jgi:hypothetical protein
MAASTVGITGSGPLSITDKNGAQRFVPLSAFELTGSKVSLKTGAGQDWATELAKTIDVNVLLALAADRVAAGELTAPPARRASPAILLSAAAPGREGNGISVDVTPDSLDDVTLTAGQQLAYAGLNSAAAAQAAIGDATGTGPVQVTALGDGTKAPKPIAPTAVKKSKTLDVKDTDDKLLFTLTNTAADDATIEVRADVDPALFVVEITRGPLTSSKVKLTALATATGDATKLVSAAPPPTGLAVPGKATVRLSGGADGVKATGVAYSS